MNQSQNSVSVIILSATFLNLSLFFIDYLGWLAPFFWIPLIFFFSKKYSLRILLLYGFLWGVFFYGPHFLWLFDLIIKKSDATTFLSFSLYLLVVIYAALTSSLLFLLIGLISNLKQNKFFKTMTVLIFFVFYFLFLNTRMFWFFNRGYPFANPIIPAFAVFAPVRHSLSSGISLASTDCDGVKATSGLRGQGDGILFLYLRPTRQKRYLDAALEIYNNIQELKLRELSKKHKNIFVVGPETTFEFDLSRRKDVIDLWGRVLPENTHFLIGSLKLKEGELLQCVYYIKNGLIRYRYDKHKRMPIVEYMPKVLHSFKPIQNLFLKDLLFIGKGPKRHLQPIFRIDENISIEPIICSELFLSNSIEDIGGEKSRTSYLVAFVNDSWFSEYFKKILYCTAHMKAFFSGKELIYVGHDEKLSDLPFSDRLG